jgi:hypothetical protein
MMVFVSRINNFEEIKLLVVDIKEFITVTNQIQEVLTGEVREKMMMQITDLKHFMECFPQEIKLIDYIKYPMCIVEINKSTKGILFQEIFTNFEPIVSDVSYVRNLVNVDEIWFVLVEEKHRGHLLDYLDIEGLKKIFDNVFHFQYLPKKVIDIL